MQFYTEIRTGITCPIFIVRLAKLHFKCQSLESIRVFMIKVYALIPTFYRLSYYRDIFRFSMSIPLLQLVLLPLQLVKYQVHQLLEYHRLHLNREVQFLLRRLLAS